MQNANIPTPSVTREPQSATTLVPREDRRREARYMLSLEVTMQGDNNFYRGLSEDISENGIFIATHHVLPIGTVVVLSIIVPNTLDPIELRGIVRWIRGAEASMELGGNFYGGEILDIKPGIGVEFQDVSQRDTRIIELFMNCRKPEFYA